MLIGGVPDFAALYPGYACRKIALLKSEVTVRYSALFLSLFVAALAYGEGNPITTKLQCHGKYSAFELKNMRDVEVSGIYVQISGDIVQIVGSPSFDATYVVTSQREDGIGFWLQDDHSIGGFVNRLDGKLSLMAKGKPTADGGFKIRRVVLGVCSSASPMF